MNINDVIRRRLKACRINKGLSQDELAKALDYTDRSTIAKMETGKNPIPSDIRPRLALVLGVTEAYLSAKLYEALHVLDVAIWEDELGGAKLVDSLTAQSVEYSPDEWFRLQSEDAFREVWDALYQTKNEKAPPSMAAEGHGDNPYYKLNPENRAVIDALIGSLIKAQSDE